jgi:hypothetical protein
VIKNFFLKLWKECLLIQKSNGHRNQWLINRVRALNNEPKDDAFARDSLVITSALTLASGGSILEAACLGSLAAAVQVGRVGNTPLKAPELLMELS